MMLERLGKALGKNFLLITICVMIIGLTTLLLWRHYQKFGFDGRIDIVYTIESKLLDAKVKLRGVDTSPTKVGILAIDEQTLAELGRWPLSRKLYDRAFQNLKKLGVQWIGFDVIYAEPEATRLEDAMRIVDRINSKNVEKAQRIIHRMLRNSPSDRSFVKAIESFENIILGFFFFRTKFETTANLGDRYPFQGLDEMESAELYNVLLPDGREISDYPKIEKGHGLTANISALNQATEHFAFFSNQADYDAINRWITLVAKLDGRIMPSLALKTAAEYLDSEVFIFFDDYGIEGITLVNREDEDKTIEIPVDALGAGRMLINHRGPSQSFPYFSFLDAYNNTFSEEDKEKLQDSVLLLGGTATGIYDLRPNPFDPAIDGVENHAAAVDNIIQQNFMKRPVKLFQIEMGIVVIVGLLFAPLMIWGRAIISGFAVIAFLVGYWYYDKLVWFDKGIWTFMAIPYIEILTMFVATNLIKYILEEKDKQFLKEAFGSYISPELIEEMHNTGQPPQLGGESGIRTAYFTDIQSFSSFSEQLTAVQLVELLNEYLTAMTDILLEEKGTLDKYEGDAIIAFFGAPMPLEDHATRACMVAHRMQMTLLDLRKKWVSEGDRWPQIVKDMRMRIGINSGEIVTGNMGSRDRMNYTMMGDSVNLAARLEEAAKQYGIFTQVSQFTAELTGDNFVFRELDTIRVVGKTEPVTTYDLLGVAGETPDPLMLLKTTFEKGIQLYKDSRWDEAIAVFEESLVLEYERFPDLKGKKTNPSLVYIERCKDYKENPPPADWGGVYTLTKK